MADRDFPTSGVSELLRLEDLPLFSPKRADLNSHKLVGFDSHDTRARPFNLLRSSLSKKLKENGLRLIGMTSATPAAGKSYLSLNLASSLARVADQPVFLVDLDIRRASVAEEIGLEVDRGIESFLEGESNNLAELGRQVEGTQLAIFPAVRRKLNTAELLASERFAQMIDIFRNRSDAAIVLFDLPPAFASDDTMIGLEQLDGYVLVVDSGKTTKKHVEDVLAVLHPTPCVGTILNRYKGGFADTYGYGYGGPDYGKYYDPS